MSAVMVTSSAHLSLSSQYLVFKLFAIEKKEEGEESGAGSETRVAVHSIQVFGHKYSQVELANLEFLSKLEKASELPDSEEGRVNVEGGVVLVKVLSFLASMLRDLGLLHKKRKAASLDPTLINVRTCYCKLAYMHICSVSPTSSQISQWLQLILLIFSARSSHFRHPSVHIQSTPLLR